MDKQNPSSIAGHAVVVAIAVVIIAVIIALGIRLVRWIIGV